MRAPVASLERLEALPPAGRLAVAWLLCAAPRALALAVLGPGPDLRALADPTAPTESFWYPAYEWIAALSWAVSGGRVPVHAGLQLALQAGIGPAVYGASRRLGLSAAVAWGTVLGVAFLPYYVSTAVRQPQVGVTLAWLAAVLWLYAHWSATGWRSGPGIGFALLGAAGIGLRPNALVSVVALEGLALLRGRIAPLAPPPTRRAVAVSLVTLFGGALAVGSWSPLPPVLGHNVWVGHNPRTGEYLRRHDVDSAEDAYRDHGYPAAIASLDDPRERDAALLRAGLEHARGHPGETLRNTGWKVLRYWDFRLEDAERTSALGNALYTGPYLLYAALAAWGVRDLLHRRAHWPLAVLGTLVLSYWLPHLVLFPTIRMRMTTEFAVLVLAAQGAAALLARAGTSPSAPDTAR